MNVISVRTLRRFWEKYPDSKTSLESWYKVARKAGWSSLIDVRRTYPHADLVGRLTVFNIGGNKYRLVVDLNYSGRVIFIKHVLTHAEYSRGGWK